MHGFSETEEVIMLSAMTLTKNKRFPKTSAILALSLLVQLMFSMICPAPALAGEKWESPLLAGGNNWINVLAREDNSLWAGTNGGGILKWDLTTRTYQTYTVANGELPENTIHSIAIDSEGNKWFGTDAGVYKFDGVNWVNYNAANTSNGLADNSVNAIAIDSEGNKWFGTYAGASKLSADGSWTAYLDELAHPYVRSIAIDSEGNVWFGTEWNGVSKFDGNNWVTFNTTITSGGLTHDCVYSIAIDSEGNKWFGTQNGVSKFDDTNWKTYNTSDGLTHETVYAIAIDSSGNKWFATHHNGISKFDDITWTTYNTYNSNLPHNRVNSVIVDSSQDKWFGTADGIGALVNDNTPPEIISTDPPDSSTGFSISSDITATFSDRMDQATIGDANFIIEDSNGDKVWGEVSYDPSAKSAVFNPYSDLDYASSYTAKITTGVRDVAGNYMTTDKVWSFTTEDLATIIQGGSTSWYFAEGCTNPGFDTWLTLQNPNDSAATVDITYMYRDGTTKTTQKAINANSRETVNVNTDAGANKELSIHVESNQQIVAERPMYFNYQGMWSDGQTTLGIRSL
jgi:streptogramin lyase